MTTDFSDIYESSYLIPDGQTDRECSCVWTMGILNSQSTHFFKVITRLNIKDNYFDS